MSFFSLPLFFKNHSYFPAKNLLSRDFLNPWAKRFNNLFAQEDDRWILWIPVAFLTGLSVYFATLKDPQLFDVFGFLCLGILCVCLWKSVFPSVKFFALCGFFFTIGWFYALGYVAMIDPPVLPDLTLPIWVQGRIIDVGHQGGRTRLFQRIVLCPQNLFTKHKIIISIRTDCPPLYPGDIVRLRAKIYPFPPPSYPGDFNARRLAFFNQIAAKGFAVSGVKLVGRNTATLDRWRQSLSRRLLEKMPVPLGGLACALVTGDKGAIPMTVVQNFSYAGLSHILAISGLHLSIASGFCFFIFHRLLSWIPFAALYINLQKLAAFASLGLGWLYLKISGQGYPAGRSFGMMALALFGLLISRRTLSIRSTAWVCMIFLILDPKAILSLGFQLSFIAVVSLVSLFVQTHKQTNTTPSKFFYRLMMSVISCATVTLATFPIATFHFHELSLQGLASNLLAIPLTSFVIIPFGFIALICMAFPMIEPFPLWLWEQSLTLLNMLAQGCATHLKFLVFPFAPYPLSIFAAQMLGVFWLLLWRKKWRFAGLGILMGATMIAPLLAKTPHFLVDVDQALLGHIDEQKILWLNRSAVRKFQVQRWMKVFGCKNVRIIQSWPFFIQKNGQSFSLDSMGTLSSDLGPIFILQNQTKGQTQALWIDQSGVVIRSTRDSHRPWDEAFSRTSKDQ